MPFSSSDAVTSSPGSGGANLVMDNFVDPGNGQDRSLPLSGICVGTYNGTYEVVGPAAALPVSLSTSVAVTQSGVWLADMRDGAGNALLSATAAPGASDRGLIVRMAGSVTQGTAAAATAPWPVSLSNSTTTATFTTIGSKVSLDVNIAAQPRSGTATQATITSSATSVTLLAANAARLQATIFNDSAQPLYVNFAATAAASVFVVKMLPGQYYELPQPAWAGVISGLWANVDGSAKVCEMT